MSETPAFCRDLSRQSAQSSEAKSELGEAMKSHGSLAADCIPSLIPPILLDHFTRDDKVLP